MPKRSQRGSLRKRKSGGAWQWLASWWEDGHRRATTLGKCADIPRSDALHELATITQRLNEQAGSAEYTLQGYVRDIFIPFYKRKWKHSTFVSTSDRLEHHLLRNLGNKPLSWFNRYNLQDFLDELARTPTQRPEKKDGVIIPTMIGASTICHLRWDLRQIFEMCVNDGLLQRNPALLLHTPEKQARPKRVLTINELRTLLNALPVRDRLIVSLAGISGLRPGEILGLQWQDIQPDGVHITRGIYRGIIQTPKTHHSVRTAAISTSIREDFDAWRAIAPNTKLEDWIFPNEKGNKPLAHGNYWRRYIAPTLQKIKLDGVTFLALRRTAVTLLNANGADASVVAAQCGHTVDVSTNVYNRIGIQRQQEALDLLARAIETRPGIPS